MNTSIDGQEMFENLYGHLPKAKFHLSWVPSDFVSNTIYGAALSANDQTVTIAYVSGTTLRQMEVPFHNLLLVEYD